MAGMYSAHFDEGGTQDEFNRVLVVAGCVSSILNWLARNSPPIRILPVNRH
jgi:hypothetical protein